jgi:hypothetical protein
VTSNPSKAEIISFTRTTEELNYELTLGNSSFVRTDCILNLDEFIDCRLPHNIYLVFSKTAKLSSLIRANSFSAICSLLILYLILIRRKREYAFVAYNSYKYF